ncbi:MAG: 4a-hydroxytetrahydrobiopterin dehydratase [Flavobacteriaceae bacterium]|nr:4a-hydroxytetrahydrobiopterin dehydratase [Flavobacteriaceae bacterium]
MKIKTKEQINLFLENTSNQWSFTDGHLRLEINFKNYIETFSFGTRIGLISEALNHHPTLTIDYNKLVIKIKTHSENGITEKDFQFVAIVNQNLKSN